MDTCNRKRLCSNFANPLNFPFVMDEFKKLRICLAHFGSEYFWKQFLDHPEDKDSWFLLIKDMMEKYKNLYTDISYTLNNQEYFPLLKVLLADPKIKDQILFGSDYYMVENKATERRFGLDLRGYLGEENFRTIARDNPGRFLGMSFNTEHRQVTPMSEVGSGVVIRKLLQVFWIIFLMQALFLRSRDRIFANAVSRVVETSSQKGENPQSSVVPN